MWRPGITIDRWGPSVWNTLHVFAHTSPIQPTVEEREATRAFLRFVAARLPCPECSRHFSDFLDRRLDEPSLASRDALIALLNDAHNEVNVRTGKRVFSLEEHRKIYARPAPYRKRSCGWASAFLVIMVVLMTRRARAPSRLNRI